MRRLTSLSFLFLLAMPLPWAQAPQPVIRAHVDVVNVLATVRDRRGNYVKDLTINDFEVYEDGVKQSLSFFNYETGENAQPLTVVLAIDTSGSVKEKLNFEQKAASEFLAQTLRKNKDMAAIIQFDSEIIQVHDFTFDLSMLEKAILQIRAGGATKLYDAIYLAVVELLVPEVGRKVLVILSDGADTQSVISEDEAIRASQENDVIIYAIGVRSRRMDSDFGKLKKFARATGGHFFTSKASLTRLRAAFAQINREIKNQVGLGYVSSNQKKDGTFRRIQVKVKRGLKVTHRRGYYAPGPSS
ncbi:MAG: VWA domain-containing protein [Acidobacteriota bacterium]